MEANGEQARIAQERVEELEAELGNKETAEMYKVANMAAAQKEAEIYKRLYEDLLARALG
jgi:hypothetical protein